MKIEVGKIYKSTILAYATGVDSSGNQVGPPEEWEIHFKLPSGQFLGRQINRMDQHIAWREFAEDGRDGTTATGKYRNLIPNTVKKEYWGFSYKIARVVYISVSLFAFKEAAEKFVSTQDSAYKCEIFSFIREEEA